MKSTNTFGVQFVARNSKLSSLDLLIYARITVNSKRIEISLKKTVHSSYWDPKAGRVKGNKDLMRQVNPYIEDVRFKLIECYLELQLSNKPITAQSIKELFLGEEKKAHSLCSLMVYHNVNMKDVLAPGTLKNYFTTERYVKRFLANKHGKTDIYLSELNYQFITEFEFFLRRNAPLQASNPLTNNGIMKHMERLRKMVTMASKMEWISKDPFQQYTLRFQKVDKAYLTTQELLAVETQPLPFFRLHLPRDLFVFSCYTGLAYVDLMRLKPTNICIGIDGEYWIKTFRTKTETPVNVPILPPAKLLVEKYRNDPRAINKGIIFPYLPNQKLNAYLKEIAIVCRIKKDFSFHMARHTFATTVTLSNGVPIETVSKMLGHTKLSTTQIYARVIEKKVSEDMHTLRNKLGVDKSETNLKIAK